MKTCITCFSFLCMLAALSACPQTGGKQQATGEAFRASFCEPLNPTIIEMGDIAAERITATFDSIPWASLLETMQGVDESRIYFSPSLEIENKRSRHGIVVSAVGEPDDYEFYIFYKRPGRKDIFGTEENEIITDITGQSRDDAIVCLQALTEGNTEWLEQKIK